MKTLNEWCAEFIMRAKGPFTTKGIPILPEDIEILWDIRKEAGREMTIDVVKKVYYGCEKDQWPNIWGSQGYDDSHFVPVLNKSGRRQIKK